MDEYRLPLDVPGLISLLDKVYPQRHPKLTDADREVWFKAGQRSVVDHLQFLLDEHRNST